jgi:hypothetical protein
VFGLNLYVDVNDEHGSGGGLRVPISI